ncbi:hypothetical protein [Mesorhizobium neociceri]|uniref:Uncharacterized protein n=1 Tax=Mesorhizobium neociceri TaxID=1307853 RepID=A0A838B819_9HYPH|nr:hypothetical protein [Mesorhizobium neociceri]MBA1142227.1 hypothetical protein [Mesorhizobium neociceri]
MIGTEIGKESSHFAANCCERNLEHRDSSDLLVKLTFSCNAVDLMRSSAAYRMAKIIAPQRLILLHSGGCGNSIKINASFLLVY